MARKEEIGIVVDDFDNVLKYIKFGDMKQSERRRDTSVFLFNDKNEVLIAKRSNKKSILPGYWGPTASGSVEEHESYTKNIYKELEEELGISDVELDFFGNLYFDFKDGKRFSGLFKGHFNQSIKSLSLQEEEVEEARWISITDLLLWIESGDEKVAPSMKQLLNAVGIDTPPDTTEFSWIVDQNDKKLYVKQKNLIKPSEKTHAV